MGMFVDRDGAYKPHIFVQALAIIWTCMIAATGYSALFLGYGSLCNVSILNTADACLLTLGAGDIDDVAAIRSWGSRQAATMIGFLCAFYFKDKNVYRTAYLTFIARCTSCS